MFRIQSLIAKSRYLYLVSKLLDFALTNEEWQEYAQISGLSINGLALDSFETFYREAGVRDTAMAVNLQKAMDKSGVKVGVIVTGGFHSTGIEQELVSKNITVISYAPKISKVEDETGSSYLASFVQEKTPLDKLFAGEKLFLAHEPMTAAPPTEALTDLSTHILFKPMESLPQPPDLSPNELASEQVDGMTGRMIVDGQELTVYGDLDQKTISATSEPQSEFAAAKAGGQDLLEHLLSALHIGPQSETKEIYKSVKTVEWNGKRAAVDYEVVTDQKGIKRVLLPAWIIYLPSEIRVDVIGAIVSHYQHVYEEKIEGKNKPTSYLYGAMRLDGDANNTLDLDQMLVIREGDSENIHAKLIIRRGSKNQVIKTHRLPDGRQQIEIELTNGTINGLRGGHDPDDPYHEADNWVHDLYTSVFPGIDLHGLIWKAVDNLNNPYGLYAGTLRDVIRGLDPVTGSPTDKGGGYLFNNFRQFGSGGNHFRKGDNAVLIYDRGFLAVDSFRSGTYREQYDWHYSLDSSEPDLPNAIPGILFFKGSQSVMLDFVKELEQHFGLPFSNEMTQPAYLEGLVQYTIERIYETGTPPTGKSGFLREALGGTLYQGTSTLRTFVDRLTDDDYQTLYLLAKKAVSRTSPFLSITADEEALIERNKQSIKERMSAQGMTVVLSHDRQLRVSFSIQLPDQLRDLGITRIQIMGLPDLQVLNKEEWKKFIYNFFHSISEAETSIIRSRVRDGALRLDYLKPDDLRHYRTASWDRPKDFDLLLRFTNEVNGRVASGPANTASGPNDLLFGHIPASIRLYYFALPYVFMHELGHAIMGMVSNSVFISIGTGITLSFMTRLGVLEIMSITFTVAVLLYRWFPFNFPEEFEVFPKSKFAGFQQDIVYTGRGTAIQSTTTTLWSAKPHVKWLWGRSSLQTLLVSPAGWNFEILIGFLSVYLAFYTSSVGAVILGWVGIASGLAMLALRLGLGGNEVDLRENDRSYDYRGLSLGEKGKNNEDNRSDVENLARALGSMGILAPFGLIFFLAAELAILGMPFYHLFIRASGSAKSAVSTFLAPPAGFGKEIAADLLNATIFVTCAMAVIAVIAAAIWLFVSLKNKNAERALVTNKATLTAALDRIKKGEVLTLDEVASIVQAMDYVLDHPKQNSLGISEEPPRTIYAILFLNQDAREFVAAHGSNKSKVALSESRLAATLIETDTVIGLKIGDKILVSREIRLSSRLEKFNRTAIWSILDVHPDIRYSAGTHSYHRIASGLSKIEYAEREQNWNAYRSREEGRLTELVTQRLKSIERRLKEGNSLTLTDQAFLEYFLNDAAIDPAIYASTGLNPEQSNTFSEELSWAVFRKGYLYSPEINAICQTLKARKQAQATQNSALHDKNISKKYPANIFNRRLSFLINVLEKLQRGEILSQNEIPEIVHTMNHFVNPWFPSPNRDRVLYSILYLSFETRQYIREHGSTEFKEALRYVEYVATLVDAGSIDGLDKGLNATEKWRSFYENRYVMNGYYKPAAVWGVLDAHPTVERSEILDSEIYQQESAIYKQQPSPRGYGRDYDAEAAQLQSLYGVVSDRLDEIERRLRENQNVTVSDQNLLEYLLSVFQSHPTFFKGTGLKPRSDVNLDKSLMLRMARRYEGGLEYRLGAFMRLLRTRYSNPSTAANPQTSNFDRISTKVFVNKTTVHSPSQSQVLAATALAKEIDAKYASITENDLATLDIVIAAIQEQEGNSAGLSADLAHVIRPVGLQPREERRFAAGLAITVTKAIANRFGQFPDALASAFEIRPTAPVQIFVNSRTSIDEIRETFDKAKQQNNAWMNWLVGLFTGRRAFICMTIEPDAQNNSTLLAAIADIQRTHRNVQAATLRAGQDFRERDYRKMLARFAQCETLKGRASQILTALSEGQSNGTRIIQVNHPIEEYSIDDMLLPLIILVTEKVLIDFQTVLLAAKMA